MRVSSYVTRRTRVRSRLFPSPSPQSVGLATKKIRCRSRGTLVNNSGRSKSRGTSRITEQHGDLPCYHHRLPRTSYYKDHLPRHLHVRSFAGGVRRNERDAARKFVEDRGYSPEIAKGVVDALMAPGTGITAGTVLSTVTRMAGRYEVGEDAGLEAMAKAVEQELALQEGKKVVRFKVHPPGTGPLFGDPKGKHAFECEGVEGLSLKEFVEFGQGKGADILREYLECACDGIMACSTCQVVVNPEWYNEEGGLVKEPSEEEQDMLDLAYDPQPTSRLGCQIILRPELDGMELTIPGGANNLFDFIPFE